jgi:hypothetical protein
MSMTVLAMATARRNVVERIARFLDDLERDGREPGHWQGDQVRHALAALERGNYSAGEDAMMRAERPDLFRSAILANRRAMLSEVPTLANLRASLARLRADD